MIDLSKIDSFIKEKDKKEVLYEKKKPIRKLSALKTDNSQDTAHKMQISLKISPHLNEVIESLRINSFGIKRSKQQWITEAVFAKIEQETGEKYRE